MSNETTPNVQAAIDAALALPATQAEAREAVRPTTPAIAYQFVEAATVKHPRTEGQVKDAVRQLAAKLKRIVTSVEGGYSLTLYTITVAQGPGTIRVTVAEPDRTMTGQPDVILAAIELDQDVTAVELYREGKGAWGKGMSRAVEFSLGYTDPEYHDMAAAWRVLVELHADAGQPGRRTDWTDREVLEWIRDHHVDGVKALWEVENQVGAALRLYGPTLTRNGRF